MEGWDVLVIGGGILGTSVGNWLSSLYEGRIGVVEREARVADHTSRRNTGVVHRPFYLDPEKRRIFARSAQASYGIWKDYARERNLPWSPVGTLEVAMDEDDFTVVEKYLRWGLANGMGEEELRVLDGREVRALEPNVECYGAIHSRTDTGVDYRAFTEAMKQDAEARGCRFLLGAAVEAIGTAHDGNTLHVRGRGEPLLARYLINCAGGDSVGIAHMVGVGLEYTDLHFRGEYWVVDPEHGDLAHSNVYSVPRHRDLPFLDPHWIVRANGQREIGPNAVPVAGSHQYEGLIGSPGAVLRKFYEPPVANKARLLFNPEFINLALGELMSSVSKAEMVGRIQRFMPKLRTEYLTRRGFAGIRSNVIDPHGDFVKEAIDLDSEASHHIINYNSPGATGAPAYAAYLVHRLAEAGHLGHLRERPAPASPMMDYDRLLGALNV